jgi:hypothetical protein
MLRPNKRFHATKQQLRVTSCTAILLRCRIGHGSPLPIEFPGLGLFTHGYILTEIGRAVGLHDATISHIIMALEKTLSSEMGPRSGRKQHRMSSLL